MGTTGLCALKIGECGARSGTGRESGSTEASSDFAGAIVLQAPSLPHLSSCRDAINPVTTQRRSDSCHSPTARAVWLPLACACCCNLRALRSRSCRSRQARRATARCAAAASVALPFNRTLRHCHHTQPAQGPFDPFPYTLILQLTRSWRHSMAVWLWCLRASARRLRQRRHRQRPAPARSGVLLRPAPTLVAPRSCARQLRSAR